MTANDLPPGWTSDEQLRVDAATALLAMLNDDQAVMDTALEAICAHPHPHYRCGLITQLLALLSGAFTELYGEQHAEHMAQHLLTDAQLDLRRN